MNPNISTLPKDVLVQMALELDLPEILSLCNTSVKMNVSVCRNRDFWINKLRYDYDIGFQKEKVNNPRQYYEFVYKIDKKYPDANRLLMM